MQQDIFLLDNIKKVETHRQKLLRYLSDGKWHSLPELMQKFQMENYGAFWSGLRTRASELHKKGLLESRIVKGQRYAEYKIV